LLRFDARQGRLLEYRTLRRLVASADAASGLRSTLLRHFGDPAAPAACRSGGNCARRTALDAGWHLRRFCDPPVRPRTQKSHRRPGVVASIHRLSAQILA
jgi:hypothetical protein